ncbi:mitochondrial ribosomal protein L46 [Leptinotarsa decemlineata]|uniref:mitochondrial ribosomal protein L46 n=1 Tax=Leptinotarsa decemlineata TaxID=7539 RepID=UPI003D307D04
MIRNSRILNLSIAFRDLFRAQSSTTFATAEKWDLLTAVCLERKPVITPAMNEIEREYKQLLSEVELEKSLKSNIELRHEEDLKQLEILKRGGDLDDMDSNLKQTAQDLMDLWSEEASKFKPASTTTEADKKNDLKSLSRKLDKSLVFVLNQKIGDKYFYMLPQDLRQDGETLRQTAERTLKQTVGSEVKAQIFGNAPCGFYKYKYPASLRKETDIVGAKVFIYFARYLNGHISQKNLDFRWLDKNELEKILPPKYSASVCQCLLDE